MDIQNTVRMKNVRKNRWPAGALLQISRDAPTGNGVTADWSAVRVVRSAPRAAFGGCALYAAAAAKPGSMQSKISEGAEISAPSFSVIIWPNRARDLPVVRP